MTKEEILKQIKFWENEADCAEEELDNALSNCRHYYRLLDDLNDSEE